MHSRGRVQRFGDDINTDYIIAAQHKASSVDIGEMAKHTFQDIDPGFSERVEPGDVVVAGSNFGCGSSRETAVHVLKALGVSAVLAQSFARIYYRNAINSGLYVFECDTTEIHQGDEMGVDLEGMKIYNYSRKREVPFVPFPPVMQRVLELGGMVPYLHQYGDLRFSESDGPVLNR